MLLRAHTTTARDSAWAGPPKVGNEYYRNTDFPNIIAYGLQLENAMKMTRQTKMLMSAMTYMIKSPI